MNQFINNNQNRNNQSNNNIYSFYLDNKDTKIEKPYYIESDKKIKNEYRKSKLLLVSFYLIVIVVGISLFYMYSINKYEFYLKEDKITIDNGSSYQIKLIPKDESIFDYLNYNYEIEDENIAKVDKFGTIEAIGNGTTKLYIKPKYGLNKKEITIQTENIPIEKIYIKPENKEIIQDTIILKQYESIKIASRITGRENTNISVDYWSSDSSIATVDNYGNVEALEIGEATIIGETKDGIQGKILVKVVKHQTEIEDIEFQEKEINITVGKEAKLTLIKTPSDSIDEIINYTSNNDCIQVNENGIVKAIKIGTAIITATTRSGKQAYCVINVQNNEIKINNIYLNISNQEIKTGNSYQIIATIEPNNATNRNLIWSSSNPYVATVENGKVTGKNIGTTTISVKSENGITKTCNITVSSNKIYINNLKIVENNLKIKKGTKIKLTVITEPNNATERKLTWKSNNSNIIIDDTGLLTALKPGESTITVESTNGKKATSKLTITEESIPINKLSLNIKSKTLNKGETLQLITNIEPNNATERTISWSSSNSNVATIQNGMIYAKGSGKAIITAKTNNGKIATCEITVQIPVINIKITTNTTTIKINDKSQLKTTIEPSNATNKTITWSSSNTNIATVDKNGYVLGKKEGYVIITATSINGKKANQNIKVEKKHIDVSKITINPKNVELFEGTTATLIASIEPSNATNKTITWSSKNTKIVEVDKNGKIKAKSIGTTTITASSGGKTATCNITVKSNIIQITKISLSIKETTMYLGESLKLTATIEPSNATNKTISWSSNNKKVATVDNYGTIKTISEGTAQITAKTNNGKTTICNIIVKKQEINIKSLSLNYSSKSLNINETLQLNATINPSNTTMNKSITWKSSNTSIAKVDKNGKVTAINSGNATITATSINGKKTTCNISVKANGNPNLFGLTQEEADKKFGKILDGLFTGKTKETVKEQNIGSNFALHFIDMLYVKGKYYAYYITYLTKNKNAGVGLAISTDGINFTNRGCVIQPDDKSFDYKIASFPGIWLDDDGTFHMVYESKGNNDLGRISYATSKNGITWTKHGVILKEKDGYRKTTVGTPDLFKIKDTWYLTFHGFNWVDCQIGLAYGKDLKNLTVTNNPIIPTKSNTRYSGTTGKRDIIYIDGWYYMVYEISTDQVNHSYDTAKWTHMFARSKDMINWTHVGPLLIQTDSNGKELRGYGNDGPCWVIVDDKIYVYYRNRDNNTSRALLSLK